MPNNWITQQEAKHLSKIAGDIEYAMFFGEAAVKRRDLKIKVAKMYEQGLISKKESNMLAKIIDSPAEDDLQFAETLMETLINRHGSNISITESQVPELRS